MKLRQGIWQLACCDCQHQFEIMVGITKHCPTTNTDLQCELCDSTNLRKLLSNSQQLVVPERMKDENRDYFKKAKETEPSDDVIRGIHVYNYNEEPSRKDIADIKRHRLICW